MHYTWLLMKQRYRMRPVLPVKMYFKEVMAMRTKNRLKGHHENLNAAFCVRELSAMVSCFKRTDFDEGPCSKEVATFKECVERESKALAELRASLQEGAVDPDAVRLSYKQINNLFTKWPAPGASMKSSWVLPGTIPYSDVPDNRKK